MNSRYLLLIIATAMLAGCASTRVTSYRDPDFYSTHFTNVMVVVDHPNLELKFGLEERVAGEFRDEGVPATEHYQVFPPTREYTPEQELEVLKEKGIDAILVINPGAAGWESTYVPPSLHIDKETEKTGDGERTKTTVHTHGGYNLNSPWAESGCKLYEVESARCAWMSSAFTGGTPLATMKTVDNSFASEIVEVLIEEGVVMPSRR